MSYLRLSINWLLTIIMIISGSLLVEAQANKKLDLISWGDVKLAPYKGDKLNIEIPFYGIDPYINSLEVSLASPFEHWRNKISKNKYNDFIKVDIINIGDKNSKSKIVITSNKSFSEDSLHFLLEVRLYNEKIFKPIKLNMTERLPLDHWASKDNENKVASNFSSLKNNSKYLLSDYNVDLKTNNKKTNGKRKSSTINESSLANLNIIKEKLSTNNKSAVIHSNKSDITHVKVIMSELQVVDQLGSKVIKSNKHRNKIESDYSFNLNQDPAVEFIKKSDVNRFKYENVDNKKLNIVKNEFYIVKPGDSLWKISKYWRLQAASNANIIDMMAHIQIENMDQFMNGDINAIRVGDKFRLTTYQDIKASVIAVQHREKEFSRISVKGGKYEVVLGDTLYDIAKAWKKKVGTKRNISDLTSFLKVSNKSIFLSNASHALKAGDQLYIPEIGGTADSLSAVFPELEHIFDNNLDLTDFTDVSSDTEVSFTTIDNHSPSLFSYSDA